MIDLIDEWLSGDGAANIGVEYSTRKLHEELTPLALAGRVNEPAMKNARSLGQWITEHLGTLAARYGLTEREGGGRVRYLTFLRRTDGEDQ